MLCRDTHIGMTSPVVQPIHQPHTSPIWKFADTVRVVTLILVAYSCCPSDPLRSLAVCWSSSGFTAPSLVSSTPFLHSESRDQQAGLPDSKILLAQCPGQVQQTSALRVRYPLIELCEGRNIILDLRGPWDLAGRPGPVARHAFMRIQPRLAEDRSQHVNVEPLSPPRTGPPYVFPAATVPTSALSRVAPGQLSTHLLKKKKTRPKSPAEGVLERLQPFQLCLGTTSTPGKAMKPLEPPL